MVLFWVAAAALSLAAAILIARGAFRAAGGPADADPAVGLYQRQMSEIDDLVDRGLLDESERRSARAEAARRLLGAADRDAPVRHGAGKPNRMAIFALVLLAPLGAMVLYLVIGAPGSPDQPYRARVEQWREVDPSSLNPAELVAVLESVVKERPDDIEGARFLAQAQVSAGDPFGAEVTLRKAVAAAPARPDLWMLLAAAIAEQSDGKFNAEARAALERALQLDPKGAAARYYTGQARIETGAVQEGLTLWRSLLAELEADAPEREQLARTIGVVEQTGRLPAATTTQPAVEPEMQAAVRGMVERLAGRLAANPDDADGWVRLVRSYTVLGEIEERDEALADARARFQGRPEVLSALAQAAGQ